MEALNQVNLILESMVNVLRNIMTVITFVIIAIYCIKVGIPKTKEKLLSMLLATSTGIVFLWCWRRQGFDQTYTKFNDLAKFILTVRQPT